MIEGDGWVTAYQSNPKGPIYLDAPAAPDASYLRYFVSTLRKHDTVVIEGPSGSAIEFTLEQWERRKQSR